LWVVCAVLCGFENIFLIMCVDWRLSGLRGGLSIVCSSVSGCSSVSSVIMFEALCVLHDRYYIFDDLFLVNPSELSIAVHLFSWKAIISSQGKQINLPAAAHFSWKTIISNRGHKSSLPSPLFVTLLKSELISNFILHFFFGAAVSFAVSCVCLALSYGNKREQMPKVVLGIGLWLNVFLLVCNKMSRSSQNSQ